MSSFNYSYVNFCNKMLLTTTTITKSDDEFVECNNYVFRLENLLENKTIKMNDQQLKQLILLQRSLNKKCPQLMIYLNEKRSKVEPSSDKSSPIEIVEVVLEDSIEADNIKQNSQRKEEEPEKPKEQDNQNIKDKFIEMFKTTLRNDNSSQILISIIKDLALNYNVETIDHVCNGLILINNDKEIDSKNCLINENDLEKVIKSLIQVNSTTTVLSYSITCRFVESLIGDYVLKHFEIINKKENSNLLTKTLLDLVGNVNIHFKRPFITGCVIKWLIEIINSHQNNSECSSLNHQVVDLKKEFLLKIIKDNFDESNCNTDYIILLLKELFNFNQNNNQIHWPESIYVILTSLFDRLHIIDFEMFSHLIERMTIDAEHLSKSIVFSKLLLNILNRNKTLFISDLKKNDHLIKSIESIIETNKTIIKRTLSTFIKKL
jgi:hypothetical protein